MLGFNLPGCKGFFDEDGGKAGQGSTFLPGELLEFHLHLFGDPATQHDFVWVLHNVRIVYKYGLVVKGIRKLFLYYNWNE